MALDYGIKVSQAGFDISSANDRQLIFKTDHELIKVASSGTTSLTAEWTEITHSLGYVPQFLVYINDSADSKTYLGTADWNHVTRADTTKVYIKRPNASGDTAYYYIFYEQA